MLKAKAPTWWPASQIEGVKRIGDTLVFDTDDRNKAINLIGSVPRQATKGMQITSTKAVSGAELETLKGLAPDLNFDGGKVFKFVAANTRKDRDNERFSPDVLKKFADDVNSGGRAFQWMHDKTKIVGTVFYADFAGTELTQYALIPSAIKMPDQPDYALTQAIEDGMIKYVSVGFRGFRQMVESKDANGNAVAEWVWFIDPARPETKEFTEQTELSLVNLGAQYGAQRKGIDSIEFIDDKVKNMSKHVKLSIGGKEYAVTAELKGEELAIGVAEVEAAVKGLEAELASAKTATEDLQKEVEAFKAPLIADIVNGQKEVAEALRNTEDELKAMPVDRLVKMVEAVKATPAQIEIPTQKAEKFSFQY